MVENLSIIPYLLGVVAMGWIPADCHDGIPKTRLHSNIWKPNLKWTGSKSPNILNNSSHWHWSFDLFNVSIFQTIWYSLVKSKDTEYFNDFNLGIFPGQEIYLWAQQFRTFYHREIVFAHHGRAWQTLKRNIKPFKDPISVFNFFSPVPFFAFQASTPYLAIPFCLLFLVPTLSQKALSENP